MQHGSLSSESSAIGGPRVGIFARDAFVEQAKSTHQAASASSLSLGSFEHGLQIVGAHVCFTKLALSLESTDRVAVTMCTGVRCWT